jgi:DNA anti-recombination protein RmuC
MPMMGKMCNKHGMMQEHMKKMENHMSNIESLLNQLVELQKQQR